MRSSTLKHQPKAKGRDFTPIESDSTLQSSDDILLAILDSSLRSSVDTRCGTPEIIRSKLEKESLICGPFPVITNSRIPLSCHDPRILNTLRARAISPRISTY